MCVFARAHMHLCVFVLNVTITYLQVGMLSLGYPKVNLQYETPDGMERLLEAIRKYIPESNGQSKTGKAESLSPPSYTPSNNNQLAFLVSIQTNLVIHMWIIIYKLLFMCVNEE